MKSNPLEKMKKRSPRTRFFWCYTLGFLLCAAGCYCWFLIKGKTLEEAEQLKNTAIAEELELPPVKIHCSILAEDAIKAAVEDYRHKQAQIKEK